MRNVLLLWIAFVGSATAQSTGDLRLVRSGGATSSSYTSGRLEVYYSGQWGTVCDDGWNSLNTRVACRQLGLSTFSTSWTTSSSGGFGSTSRPIWLDDVNCIGTESRLTSCSRNSYGVENCVHSEDVAIYCGASSVPSTGDLRLVRNGITSSSYTSGRLEVYYSGQWGTVCDDLWDSANTRVACRQLGLSTSTTSWTTSSSGGFGSATGRTWLDDVNCIGTESRLTSCSRNSYGVENCGHSEDVAIYCGASSVPSTGDLRLVRNGITSSSYTSGRLEVYYSGQWGTVCDDLWDSANTRVACRQLGLSTSTTSWTTSSSGGFGSATGRTWLDDVNCIGTESRLTSCSRNSYGVENCGHSEDVAIYCGASSVPSTGDLRLVRNGITSSSYTSGRLEVYYSGQWGTVCDDLWDSANTRVACRQLGLSTSTTSWTTSSNGGFGSATGRTWLDDVNCIGTESRLTSCSRNSYGVENCGHSEDVAIYCGTSSGGIVSSAVSIGVGVSISCLVVFVIIPIVICVLIACAASRSSRRTRTTVTTVPSTPSTTVVTTSSQQQSAQQSAYPAAGTDLKQAPPPPYEMSAAYPPQPQQGYPPQGYPPQGYPAQGYPPKQDGAYPPQGYPPQSYPPQSYPPQSYPAQGYPPQPEGAYPAQGYPAQGYPPQP